MSGHLHDLIVRLRTSAEFLAQPIPPQIQPPTWPLDKTLCEAADELVRLNNLLRSPLSPVELKMVDRHEPDWVAFKHAWNAIMKRRIAEMDRETVA